MNRRGAEQMTRLGQTAGRLLVPVERLLINCDLVFVIRDGVCYYRLISLMVNSSCAGISDWSDSAALCALLFSPLPSQL